MWNHPPQRSQTAAHVRRKHRSGSTHPGRGLHRTQRTEPDGFGGVDPATAGLRSPHPAIAAPRLGASHVDPRWREWSRRGAPWIELPKARKASVFGVGCWGMGWSIFQEGASIFQKKTRVDASFPELLGPIRRAKTPVLHEVMNHSG